MSTCCCDSCGALAEAGPRGEQGIQGATGATGASGYSTYTYLISDFTQPAMGTSVNIYVADARFMAVGMTLFIEGGGHYVINTVDVTNNTANIELSIHGTNEPASTTVPANNKVSSCSALADTGMINVKAFGAKGDYATDDTAAIQAAIDFAVTYENGAVLYFPYGIYLTSSTLEVYSKKLKIVGDWQKGAVNYTPAQYVGAHIQYTSSDGGPIMDIYRSGFVMERMRIGATYGLSTAPTGVSLREVSEIYMRDIDFVGNLNECILFDEVVIGFFDNIKTGDNKYGFVFDTHGGLYGINREIRFSNCNVWDNEYYAFYLKSNTYLSVRDTWIEFTNVGFYLEQQSGEDTYFKLACDNVTFDNGSSSTYIDTRFVKMLCQNTASNSMVCDNAVFKNCTVYNYDSDYNIEIDKNGNTDPNTYFANIVVDNGSYTGAQTSMVTSNTGSGLIRGGIRILKNVAGTAGVGFTGTGHFNYMLNRFTGTDMTTGYAIALPQTTNDFTAGQLYYGTAAARLRVTDGTAARTVPFIFTGSLTTDVASIAAGAIATIAITVTGAASGDPVVIGAPAALGAGLLWSGYVSATDTVTVRIYNSTAGAIDPASATWKASVIK